MKINKCLILILSLLGSHQITSSSATVKIDLKQFPAISTIEGINYQFKELNSNLSKEQQEMQLAIILSAIKTAYRDNRDKELLKNRLNEILQLINMFGLQTAWFLKSKLDVLNQIAQDKEFFINVDLKQFPNISSLEKIDNRWKELKSSLNTQELELQIAILIEEIANKFKENNDKLLLKNRLNEIQQLINIVGLQDAWFLKYKIYELTIASQTLNDIINNLYDLSIKLSLLNDSRILLEEKGKAEIAANEKKAEQESLNKQKQEKEISEILAVKWPLYKSEYDPILNQTIVTNKLNDPLGILGLSTGKYSIDEINKLFRKKSLKFHPDKHPENPELYAEIFKILSNAKENVLSAKKMF